MLAGLLAQPAHADLLRHCATPPTLDAAQHDRLFRLAASVRDELAASGAPVAVVARAGTDLSRIGQRYSHAGISLRDSPNTPWSVRQLYFDCSEARPRVFDQGLPGFVLGGASPDAGRVVLWLLPTEAAPSLDRVAHDDRQATALLGARYSANAYAWSTDYQNCNQWVAELLAAAWGAAPPAAAGDAIPTPIDRATAQQRLREAGYQPTRVLVTDPLVTLAGLLMPWLHTDDHPRAAVAAQQFDTSLPASIEAWLRQRWPATRRIEFCHDTRQIVVRQGWQPLGDGCHAADGDRVIPLAPAVPAGAGA